MAIHVVSILKTISFVGRIGVGCIANEFDCSNKWRWAEKDSFEDCSTIARWCKRIVQRRTDKGPAPTLK